MTYQQRGGAAPSYAEGTRRIAQLRGEIAETRRKISELQAEVPPQPVEDYVLATAEGNVRLSELFGDKDDLFVIHNMGVECPYCTLWADGFNGVYSHLADRAAFVVSSPDPPDVQRRFGEQRGWRFRMVSHAGTSFAKDMGYVGAEGGFMPGVSVFRRQAAGIVRVSDAGFEPGDLYCALWHLLDLLPEGPGRWSPKFRYG